MNGTMTAEGAVARGQMQEAGQEQAAAMEAQQKAMVQQQKDMQFEAALSKAYAPNTALEMYTAKQIGAMTPNAGGVGMGRGSSSAFDSYAAAQQQIV